jgi:hypothetical protein
VFRDKKETLLANGQQFQLPSLITGLLWDEMMVLFIIKHVRNANMAACIYRHASTGKLQTLAL